MVAKEEEEARKLVVTVQQLMKPAELVAQLQLLLVW
jgi:hypothetical protein